MTVDKSVNTNEFLKIYHKFPNNFLHLNFTKHRWHSVWSTQLNVFWRPQKIYWWNDGRRMWVSIDFSPFLSILLQARIHKSNLNPKYDPILSNWPLSNRKKQKFYWVNDISVFISLSQHVHIWFIIHDVCNLTLCWWNLASHHWHGWAAAKSLNMKIFSDCFFAPLFDDTRRIFWCARKWHFKL